MPRFLQRLVSSDGVDARRLAISKIAAVCERQASAGELQWLGATRGLAGLCNPITRCAAGPYLAPYPVRVTDWVTISSLATAGGTLVLAVATFASVRSANRAARVAEESLLVGIRPLLLPSRPDDRPLKVGFGDDHYVMTPGGGGTAEATDGVIYLTMSLRNVGNGIAVLHGWRVELSRNLGQPERPPLEAFRRLTRDLYVAAGEVAFWQGALRDPAEPGFEDVRDRIKARERILIDVLYGDHEGSQRVISRFILLPRGDSDDWFAAVGRHWNVDRPDPR
jgi:hypothetical protein